MPEVKVKTKLRILYKNPISGKWNFLFTHCPHCGRRVLIRKKNIGKNRFGDQFYYCPNGKHRE